MKSPINRKAARETATIAANLMLAPTVAAMRLPLMAFEPRSANSWGVETVRAINEKNVALAEGVAAAQLSLLQSATGFWFDVWMGRTPGLLNGIAAERSMRAALKPAGLRVKANYRRLSRKK